MTMHGRVSTPAERFWWQARRYGVVLLISVTILGIGIGFCWLGYFCLS